MSEEDASAAAWQPVGDELIAGIHHALNNRVGALAAVAQVLGMEMPPDHPLRAALADEVERLQGTVAALTLLPLRPAAVEEPVLLSELLPRVVALYGLHHGVRDTPCAVEGAAGVLPLCVEPTRLTHLLLVMLVTVGTLARQEGAGVLVRCSGDETWVDVRVASGGAGVRPGGGVGALGPWAATLGGRVDWTAEPGGGAGLVLRLPTLPEVRRRQREG